MPELILDDPDWFYRGIGARISRRRLRVWRTSPGHLTAVITEAGEGTSITNAIESIAAQLAIEYPADEIELIEHQPPGSGLRTEEEYQLVTFDHRGRPSWRTISPLYVTTHLGA